jgi:SIR2-like domain
VPISVIDIRANTRDLAVVVPRIADDLRRTKLLPFFGAGFSNDAPSNNLLSGDIRQPLIDHLIATMHDTGDTASLKPEDELDIQAFPECLESHTLERIIDSLYDLQPLAVHDYLSVLDLKTPNDNHRMLARLAVQNLIPFGATVNFDTLFEQAAQTEGATVKSVVPLIETSTDYVPPSRGTLLIKPHGSFTLETTEGIKSGFPTDRLLPALSQIGNSPHSRNMKGFRHAFDLSEAILVMGYGRRDWDVWPIIDRFRDRVKRLYWILHKRPEEADGIVNLLPNWAREERYECYAIIGDIGEVLEACLCEIGLFFARTKMKKVEPSRPPTTMFDNPIRSAIAAVSLMPEDTTGVKRRLYAGLVRRLRSGSTVDAIALSTCHSRIAWTDYVRWKMKSACRHSRKAILVAKKAKECSRSERRLRVARATLSRGHICLGTVKHCVMDFSMRRLANAPKDCIVEVLSGFAAGMSCIKVWATFYCKRDVHARLHARLQRASVVHLVALRAATARKPIRWLGKHLLKHVSRQYARAVSRADEIMTQAFLDREYFELRAMEAELMAKPSFDRLAEIEMRVEELNASLTASKSDHTPQVWLCQALVLYSRSGESWSFHKKLKDAYDKWEADGISSGTRRVKDIARCLGVRIHIGPEGA